MWYDMAWNRNKDGFCAEIFFSGKFLSAKKNHFKNQLANLLSGIFDLFR